VYTCSMKLAIALVFVALPVQAELAQPTPGPQVWPSHIPQRVVAVTADQVVLLTDTCGWPGGARRAYQATATRLIWACWGYTELGVQLTWQDGRQTHEALHRFRTLQGAPVSYPWLYERIK
jgi:hypothetical protein